MKLVVGNFKMNLSLNEVNDYIAYFKDKRYDNVIFGPSNIYLLEYINNGNKQFSNMNKNRIKLTESNLHRVIRESIKKVLREGAKGVDLNNIVPENRARKCGFKPEYAVGEDGLEIWGKTIYTFGDRAENPEMLLIMLGISNFTSYSHNKMHGYAHIRITVQPNPKNLNPKKKITKYYKH